MDWCGGIVLQCIIACLVLEGVLGGGYTPPNPELVSKAQTSCAAPECGTVLSSMNGIDAYSNGANQCTGYSCAGYATYGYQYQVRNTVIVRTRVTALGVASPRSESPLAHGIDSVWSSPSAISRISSALRRYGMRMQVRTRRSVISMCPHVH